MTNFNSVNNYIPLQNLAQTKAGLVGNSQVQQNTQNQQSQQQINQPTQQTINPQQIFTYQMAKMDNEVVLKYLQNLLNLPNSIDKFLNQTNAKNADPKMLQVLIENMINTKALSEFLNQNSTQAISKLMQTISSSLKNGVSDVSQLKEILNILVSIQNSTNINSNTLKELLLLYIPLNIPAFEEKGDFNKIEEENKEKIKNSTLSLLIQTINFSNILSCINQNNNYLLIEFYSNQDFPKENFAKIITKLSKEANINTLIEFKQNNTEEAKEQKQNLKVISQGFVPTDILILSHLIIKTIFKIDNDFSTI